MITGAVLIRTPPERVYWHRGAVVRRYPVLVRDAEGSPLDGASVTVSDSSGAGIWKGETAQSGLVTVELTFSKDNYTEQYSLVAATAGFFMSTPIILLPAKR